jgi:hypothetical protein
MTWAAVPRKNRQKQREEPGVCAKNAKDAYFISQR